MKKILCLGLLVFLAGCVESDKLDISSYQKLLSVVEAEDEATKATLLEKLKGSEKRVYRCAIERRHPPECLAAPREEQDLAIKIMKRTPSRGKIIVPSQDTR